MDKIKLCLNREKKYVVACSFGPDSMALLDAAIKEKLNIVVVHVNYRKRKESQSEQDNLTLFCNKANIKLYVLDLLGQKAKGNFQKWAREKRYEFFKEIVEKEGADAVLVAHQQDDVIETYLMQKKRKNFVKNYGISRENEIFGVKIIRPLLAYTKKEIGQYNYEHKVPFAIDKSNLEDEYFRNKIRHSIVEKLSADERKEILKEINQSDKRNELSKTTLSRTEFMNVEYEDLVLFLDLLMNKVGEHRDISRKYVLAIKNASLNKTNQRYKISKSVWIELDYENVYFVNGSKIKNYMFQIEKQGSNEFIEIDFSNGAKDRGISELPAMLTIKKCDKKDKLIIKNYSSEIRRLFIDWKMPLFLREIWPGVYDEKGNLIYVPRYRLDFKDDHESKFQIDTEYFLKF